MEWSPPNAMKAYLQTLLMCKTNNIGARDGKNYEQMVSQKQGMIEPQGLELISALAAGNQAKVIVQVTSSKQGITPLTVALAVAAKQTGGKLICIVPKFNNDDQILATYYGILDHVIRDASHVVELRVGDPCEQIKDLRKVDFVAIDSGFDSKRLIRHSFYEELHLNPKGAIIVANNVVNREEGVAFVDHVLRGKRGVESTVTTIPLGGSTGVQVIIRVKSVTAKPQRRRHKRFLVTFDA